MITATVATIPERHESLTDTLRSILPQVDRVQVYFNGGIRIPKLKSLNKLDMIAGDGSRGDSGKFFGRVEGYRIVIDDDLLYPTDYVDTMIGKLKDYGNKVVLSAHGRVFKQFPIKSYYNDSTNYRCLQDVKNDISVHVVGTGVLAYHSDLIDIHISEFKRANMADIWFSKYCNDRGIKRIVIAHKEGWIRHSEKVDMQRTICARYTENDSYQTEIMNAQKWHL